jgi:A/G-specific adenine glycosylase
MSRSNPAHSGRQPDRKSLQLFRKTITRLGRELSRPMPWRDDCSPYAVFISEVMLQQTQVERVIPKYTAFVERFPGFKELAGASLAEVYSLWQGLGYNRRAKRLRDAAIAVMEQFDGCLPESVDGIVSLPGIGKNTAGAILAYAFNKPVPYIETNIRTVFIHHFFKDREDVTDSEILSLVELTLDKKNPRLWYWALMDYGTMLKKQEGNLSRRSSSHRPQKPFASSDRRIRGIILRYIGEKESSSVKELSEAAKTEPERLQKLLSDLAKEGLVREERGVYRIGD